VARRTGRGLVGHQVERLAGGRPGGLDLGSVADERDAQCLAAGGGGAGPAERLARVIGEPVDVADVEATARPRLVDLDGDADAFVHRHRQRLGATHPAKAGRQRHGPAEGPAEVLPGDLGKGLVRTLEDALRPDVDPRPRGHLAVHHQAALLEVAEDLPGRPAADEVRIGDEDPRRPRMGAHDPDRLARLHQQRLVVGEGAQFADDRVERLPRTRGAAGPTVDDEVVRVLGHLGIEVVHEHPERGFLLPATACQLAAARRADGAGAGRRHRLVHHAKPTRADRP
jgi:hypothetical protein